MVSEMPLKKLISKMGSMRIKSDTPAVPKFFDVLESDFGLCYLYATFSLGFAKTA